MQRTTALVLATLALTAMLVSTSLAGGNNSKRVYQRIDDNGRLAYFSPRLGARFAVQRIRVGNYPPVLAARIVSQPVYGSPLSQLGITMGDVVTRLDGVPVTSTWELERHVLDTKVRYIKAGSFNVREGWTFIGRHRYFQDAYYPPSGGGWSGWSGGGLRP